MSTGGNGNAGYPAGSSAKFSNHKLGQITNPARKNMSSAPNSQDANASKGKMKSEEAAEQAKPPRLNSYLHSIKKPPYILNLDPAVSSLPFQPNIDIRDTVNYKQVMKQYNLGPNGGILTALNLFTTKFDQVLNYVEKRSASTDFVLIDTPGQIEIFTWSASGAIITDAIASSLPTVVAYIIDTPRTTAPATFMSNMLYACSKHWSPKTSRMRARAVGCSAMTGFGMKEFFEAVDEARQEYETDYRPELVRRQEERDRLKEEKKNESLEKLVKDLKLSSASSTAAPKSKTPADPTELRADEVSEWEEPDGRTLDRQDVVECPMPQPKKATQMGLECDAAGGQWPAPR
ncbi:hypothetical protein PTTG_01826 [Puccinia triticina 1-1 BBBD Race 1]|uniref:GPN-loop GTPase n=1 Tax=Puccinia triticina (isolate 1-1 / race 1 (BBBD)) TaxID=630390 RepID=A0A180H183_PUCT1|nr:hypothetical protein PTTG_01826 [Puccinia triticina 1-1 BBBD Race 1]